MYSSGFSWGFGLLTRMAVISCLT